MRLRSSLEFLDPQAAGCQHACTLLAFRRLEELIDLIALILLKMLQEILCVEFLTTSVIAWFRR
jgi:hypothetical protein